jgi:hypothetical protein
MGLATTARQATVSTRRLRDALSAGRLEGGRFVVCGDTAVRGNTLATSILSNGSMALMNWRKLDDSDALQRIYIA